jgi:putative hydrolase of the HAD superfamily
VPNAILFDLYDTLITAPWSDLAHRWATRIGITPDEVSRGFDTTRDVRGRGGFESTHIETAAIVEACGVSPSADLVADLVVSQDEFLEAQAVPFGDAFATMESLRENGVKTAILSNCSRSTQPVVDRLGLRDAVDKVVLSFEVGSAKPDSEIFRHALRLLDVDSGLFVDDQIAYLDGAARVGLSTVQMIHPEARNPRPPQATHDVVTSLAELAERVNDGWWL